jgi:hypothetical protein
MLINRLAGSGTGLLGIDPVLLRWHSHTMAQTVKA